MHNEPVTDAEIQAYLDGELDLRQRFAVEHHLAGDPEAAARFMADVELRTSLRLMAEESGEPPVEMVEAAARLAARLNAARTAGWAQIFGRPIMRMAAAAALLAVILVPARNVLASPPDFVGDAVDAYHTGLLRATMVSQVETPRLDAKEVQRSTRIRVPRLPARWVVTDAQIVPTGDGPALQLMLNSPGDERMSILIVRADTESPEEPTAVRHAGASVAYWSEGEMSYALAGEGEPEAVDSAAEDIAADNI